MSAKHTPPPWAVDPFSARVVCDTVSSIGDLLPACQMLWPTGERSEDETITNARLIATAPEAIEFARDVEACLADLLCDQAPGTGDADDDPLADLLRRARELVAKATGGAA
ncbi:MULTISPECIES: hypothetical protein [Sphingomonas]|uniref:hypothetical protein n=1 Tax=Sphingomonas TaxID=13687 RepID=UPI001454D7AC|nr:hypothetical protein [Sphingomonas sp. CCH10-B3]